MTTFAERIEVPILSPDMGLSLAPPMRTELLDFRSSGEKLPDGHDISLQLDEAMAEYGGTLQYWNPGAKVGTRSGFDKAYFQRKMNAAVSILTNMGVEIDPQDMEDSQAFVDEVFGVYSGERQPYRQSGSSAFVAATRLKRFDPNQFSPVDYRNETVGCLSLLKYLDRDSSQKVMVGLPPFGLDYQGNDRNRGGVMIFSPLFLDLPKDGGTDIAKLLELAGNVAQETTWFAEEVMDVKVMSLAALLPAATKFGKMFTRTDIPDSKIHITTGHAGTVWGIGEVGTELLNRNLIDPRYQNKIGFVGVGGLGKVAAGMFLRKMPDIQIMVHDTDVDRQRGAAERLRRECGDDRRVLEAASLKHVLEFAGLTVSAINGTIDLEEHGLPEGALVGRAYADDSQPAAISAEQIEALGGTHVGVVAEDPRPDQGGRNRFDYGRVGPKGDFDLYFCDVEGRAIAASERYDLTVQRSAKVEDVMRIGEVAAGIGFKAASLQTLRHNRAVLI